MILPAVRERLEALLRHAAMEGALAALRSGASHISITGLHDVAKALVAAYLTRELRRPAFFVTDSNRRAEALAETLRFFSGIFPGATGGVATLPAFDRLPWESRPLPPPFGAIRIPPPTSISPGRWQKTLTFPTMNCSPISAPWATREPKWSSFLANLPSAAASLTFFHLKPRAPCVSNCSATPLNPCANLIPAHSARLPRFSAPRSCP